MRENEIHCLNKIRNSFINSTGLKKEFDNSDYFTMKSILNSARHNENHSEFPDFFFDGGIIEHFEVSASNETKDGSKYRVEDFKKRKEAKKYFEELDREFLESERQPGRFFSESKKMVHQCFSYEAFVNSFRRNVGKHILSLRKSNCGTKAIVFLIEQPAGRLCVYVNDEFDRFYMLSEDRNLLSLIKESMRGVNYIIFNAIDSYEILDLSKVDDLISKAKSDLDIRGGNQINLSVKIYGDY